MIGYGMKTVLLHTCCAPCSAAIIEWMLAHDIRPVVYYFNPNIDPLEEYSIRKSECSRFAASLGLEVVDGDYDHAFWLRHPGFLPLEESDADCGSRKPGGVAI